MTHLLLIGLGGGIGSIARYLLGSGVMHLMGQAKWPLGTFTVNLLGCLVIGVLFGLAEKHAMFSAATRLFLFTGLIGGFTTFSAFGLETVLLLRRQELLAAAVYVLASVLLGIAALWLGLKLAEQLPR